MANLRKSSPTKSAGRKRVSTTAARPAVKKAVKTTTPENAAPELPANKTPAKRTPARISPKPDGTRGPGGHKRSAVERLDDPPPATGLPLIDRVSQSIEREIGRIEVIIGGRNIDPAQRSEAERRARTLASLTKTLAELRRLRVDDEQQRLADDDAIPRDLDELRRALSQRLDQLVADAAALPAAGDE